MNATAHGIAHALAHGGANASHETSDVAKTREGKGREGTTPQGILSWLSSKTKGSLSQASATTRPQRMVLPVVGLGGK